MNRCTTTCSTCFSIEVGSQSLQQRLALRGSRLLLRGAALRLGRWEDGFTISYNLNFIFDFIWFYMILYDLMIWIQKKYYEFINIIWISFDEISQYYEFGASAGRWMTWCSSTSSMAWCSEFLSCETAVESTSGSGWNSNSPEGVASDSAWSCRGRHWLTHGGRGPGQEQWATPIYRGSDDCFDDAPR